MAPVSEPPAANNSIGTPAPRGKSFLARLLSGQEFGLVIVISVMMTALTLLTPSIPRRETQVVPGATVAEVSGGFSVTANGATTIYREADGYSFRQSGDRVLVFHEYQVNKFLNKENLISVATSTSFIAVMAVGMTGIIVMGGIDLSVGSIYALAGIFGGMVLQKMIGTINEPAAQPTSVALAILASVGLCVAVGVVCGLVNGVATVGLKVHPFIITLGGMAVYRGVAFVTSGGLPIGPFPEQFTKGAGKWEAFGITPVPLAVMVLVGLVGAFVLTRTVFGRRTFAIGGNETAAKYAGIPVGQVKIWLFVICGGLAGLSSAMMLGYYGSATSDAGKGYELSVIAAAVVGGASLSGGRGSAIGAVMGAIVIQLIDNSILMLNVDQNYKEIVIGLAIVLAVVVDQTKQRLTVGAKRGH
jgi:ribose transport system permease protein